MTGRTSAGTPDILGPIDRRTFLRGTAGGALTLTLAALLPTGCGGYPEVSRLRLFTAKEFAILRAIADTCIVPDAGMPTPEDVDVAGFLDAYLAAEPAALQTQLKRALLLLEYGGLVWGSPRRRFTRMDAPERAEYLTDWLESDSPVRRQVAQTFRRACLNTYYTDERTWAAIDYEGPFVS